MIVWCRTPEEQGVEIIDISLAGRYPFCMLDFDCQLGQIPVPGMPGTYAESCTGIMEGCKLIGAHGFPGRINPGFFVGAGRERIPTADEWCLGWNVAGKAVSLADARKYLLIPAYAHVMAHQAAKAVAEIKRCADDTLIGLYDGRTSKNIKSPKPLSAAALLCACLNGDLIAFQRAERDYGTDD
jgi:hypothetical protein